MLAKSDDFAGDGLHFRLGDIATFEAGQPYDLVYSNAALQWVPGHADLLARLTAALADDGQLAFQVPANNDHPSHATAAEVAVEEPFRSALGGFERRAPLLPVEEYARLLHRLGYREQLVRLQVYGHHLGAREDVIEWVRGTTLTDYQKRLSPELYDAFLARYRERLLPRLEDTHPHFYPFKRLLVWAQR
jgi:trans-aconitate 2-methyltransferase